MNIRHDLNKEDVESHIEEKIDRLKEVCIRFKISRRETYKDYTESSETKKLKWVKVPYTPEESDALEDKMFKKSKAEELEVYAKVRVIERPIIDKPFILVYGDVDDKTVENGTGGFSTFDEATKWFFNFGR